MKRLIITSLVIGIALFSLQAQASANLLTNSGFDDPSTSPWGAWGAGNGTVTIGSTDTYRSPIKSLKLGMVTGSKAGDYGTSFQEIPFSIAQTLYGHGFIKGTLDANTQACAQFEFWGGSNLTTAKGSIFSAANITDWTEMPQFTGVVPAAVGGVTTDKVKFGLLILASGNGGTGNVYFDDVYADSQPIPEPSSLLLLGGGLVGLLGLRRKKR